MSFQQVLRNTTISTQQQLSRLERLVYADENKARPRPIAIYTAGPPGAGKSSTLSRCLVELQLLPENFIVHDPDFITQSLKYFNDQPKAHQTTIRCMNQISRPLNDRFIEKSISNGLNIIIDGTSRDAPSKLAHISRIRERGYKIIMIATYAPLQTVLARVQRRAAKTGRVVDGGIVSKIHTDVRRALPEYARSDLIDIMYLYDNSGTHARLAFRKNVDGTSCCTVVLRDIAIDIPCDRSCDSDDTIPQGHHRQQQIKGRVQSIQSLHEAH